MERIKKLAAQAVKFGLVGVLNTLIDYAVFTLLLLLPFFAKHYVLAQILGYTAGLVNSFGLNKQWTFRQKERAGGGQLLRFLLVNLAALGVSTLALVLCREGLGLHTYVCKIVATAFSMGVNFVGNKLIVFNK